MNNLVAGMRVKCIDHIGTNLNPINIYQITYVDARYVQVVGHEGAYKRSRFARW